MRHYQIRVAELTTKVGSLQHHVNTLSKQREALNEQKIRLDEAAKQIKNYPFTEGASYATELRSAEGECNQAVGQLIELESHHKRLQIQHAEAVTKAAAASAAVRWLNDLEVVKTVFGRDNLQTELAKVFFNTINTNWNQVLADMDLPFSVAFTDDMDIRLEFENNRNASILDASGGQQTCAALALMLAVNRTFAHEVGFLILDEPTYGVDQDHINNVISVLTKAGEFAENTGLQILVITHEPKIAQAFEHSYVLEAQ
jgi:DNA repair exonuclease SbcCD ATPase subunit